MYPSTFFGLFPPFPSDERAFVAMSFDTRFDARWQHVLVPALHAVRVNDKPLDVHRVDLRKPSDSILTEILDGIARCRVFVADITSLDEVSGRAVRNDNVMYEVGLAHAVRQPEEVILFRSDARHLSFDITNVRVHAYDPDGSPEDARRLVTETIVASLGEVDLKKNLAVRRVAQSLDFHSWMVLFEAQGKPFNHPAVRTVRQALGTMARAQAIGRLLEVGALQTELLRATAELLKIGEAPAERLVTYTVTPFGFALVTYGANQLGLFSPEIRDSLERGLDAVTGKSGEPA